MTSYGPTAWQDPLLAWVGVVFRPKLGPWLRNICSAVATFGAMGRFSSSLAMIGVVMCLGPSKKNGKNGPSEML